MLNHTHMLSLKVKRAQDMSAFGIGPRQLTANLGDLYLAIAQDQGVSPIDKIQLMAHLHNEAGGAGQQTPLMSLIRRGLGGMVGMLIARYFGMGQTGQALSAAGGFGLASSLQPAVNEPFAGWRSL